MMVIPKLKIKCRMKECPYKNSTVSMKCIEVLPDGSIVLCGYAVLEDDEDC